MRYAQTIAMAQNLLAEGRVEDVCRMLEPLLQEATDPMQNGEAMLRALLARAYVTHQGALTQALELLAPYEDATAREALDDTARAPVALWLGWSYARREATFTDEARALILLDEAESLYAATVDAPGQCWAHLGRARAYFTLDEYQLMRQALDEARALRRTIQDVQAKRWCHDLNVPALRFQGHYDEAATHIEALESLGRRLDDRQVLGRTHAYRAALRLDRGEAPDAVIDAATAATNLLGDVPHGGATYPLLAAYHAHIQALLRQGRWDDADVLIDTALRATDSWPTAQAHLHTLRARLYLRRGHDADARRILGALRKQAPKLPHGLHRSHIALLRGELLARADRYDEALETVARARHNAQTTGHRGNALRARLVRAKLELQRGDLDAVQHTLDQLASFDDYFGVLPFAALRFWVLGRLAEAKNRPTEAISYLKQSRSAYSLMGDLQRTAQVQLRLARLGRAARPVEARPLLDAALETFEQLALEEDADAARTLREAWPTLDASDRLGPERSLAHTLARASRSPRLVADAWIQAVAELLPDRWIGLYEYAEADWSAVYETGQPPEELTFPSPEPTETVVDGIGWLPLREGPEGTFFMACRLSSANDPAWQAARTHLATWRPVVELALDRAVAQGGSSSPQPDAAPSGDGAPPLPVMHDIVYESAALQRLVDRIGGMQSSHNPVLITGERGTGKSTMARLVHATSTRHRAPWGVVDCGASAGTLAARLLGRADAAPHEAAHGVLRAHDDGTVLLRHVDEAPLHVQDRLLDVLTSDEVFPKGASAPEDVDVRLIATTTRDLAERVQAGAFREELFYRLNVITLRVPPLRERPDDIPVLARHFATRLQPAGPSLVSITNDALDALVAYDWPGNVRQLRNEIERALSHVSSEPAPTLDRSTLSDALRAPFRDASPERSDAIMRSDCSLRDVMAEAEKETIERVLDECDGHITASADVLGLSRQGLYKKMKRLDIDASQFQRQTAPSATSP